MLKKTFLSHIINTVEAKIIMERPKPAPEKKGKSYSYCGLMCAFILKIKSKLKFTHIR